MNTGQVAYVGTMAAILKLTKDKFSLRVQDMADQSDLDYCN